MAVANSDDCAFLTSKPKLQIVKKIILAAFLVCSLTSTAQGLLGKAKEKLAGKAKTAVKADLPTDGMKSALHTKYVNKIVFASTNEAIEKGAEDESKFLTKFNLGEPLMFRVYMDNSLCNYLKSQPSNDVHGRYKMRIYLDGGAAFERLIDGAYFKKEQTEKWTTWRGALKSPDGDSYIGISIWNDFVAENESKLTMGDHKLKIEMVPYQGYPNDFTAEPAATGEITMSIGKSVVDPNDPNACLPKAGMTDKALEAKIITAFMAQGWTEVPKEVRITSTKWNIVRHKATGVIMSRFVEAYVGSDKKGTCLKQSFNFYQDYDGAGYQDDVYLKGIGDQDAISCQCLKK